MDLESLAEQASGPIRAPVGECPIAYARRRLTPSQSAALDKLLVRGLLLSNAKVARSLTETSGIIVGKDQVGLHRNAGCSQCQP